MRILSLVIFLLVASIAKPASSSRFYEKYGLDKQCVNRQLRSHPTVASAGERSHMVPFKDHIAAFLMDGSYVVHARRGAGKTFLKILALMEVRKQSSKSLIISVTSHNLREAFQRFFQNRRDWYGTSVASTVASCWYRNRTDNSDQPSKYQDMVEFVLVEVLNALIDEDSISLAKTFGEMPYEERMELAVLAGLYANPGSALKLRRFWADLKLIPQSTRAYWLWSWADELQCPERYSVQQGRIFSTDQNGHVSQIVQVRDQISVASQSASVEAEVVLLCGLLRHKEASLSRVLNLDASKQNALTWFHRLTQFFNRTKLLLWVAFDALDEVDIMWDNKNGTCVKEPWKQVVASLEPLLQIATEDNMFNTVVFLPVCEHFENIGDILSWHRAKAPLWHLVWDDYLPLYINFVFDNLRKMCATERGWWPFRKPVLPSADEVLGGPGCVEVLASGVHEPRTVNAALNAVFALPSIEANCTSVLKAKEKVQLSLTGAGYRSYQSTGETQHDEI